MTTRHQGAVTMAADVKGQGNSIRTEEMADEVIAQQTGEISRMRDVLQRLPVSIERRAGPLSAGRGAGSGVRRPGPGRSV
jgi:hypothetical protein